MRNTTIANMPLIKNTPAQTFTKRPRIARLKQILLVGYFPHELPPCFSNRQFVLGTPAIQRKSIKDEWRKIYYNRPTSCIPFSVPKIGFSRRNFGIPNPRAHFFLTEEIEQEWGRFLNVSNRSTIAAYPIENIVLSDDFVYEEMPNLGRLISDFVRTAFIASGSRIFEGQTDIQKFYGSIYTHAIPWALHGKRATKSRVQRKLHQKRPNLGENLDRLVGLCQKKETFGVPIGPGTSALIAEGIALAIDRELQKNHMIKTGRVKVFRFVDDFRIYGANREDVEQTISTIRKSLQLFNLDINAEKTQVNEVVSPLDPYWKKQLRESAELRVGSQDMLDFFDLAFSLHQERPQENILKYAVKVMRLKKAENRKLEIIGFRQLQTLLSKIALLETTTIPDIFQRFSLPSIKTFLDKTELEILVNTLVGKHLPKNHDFEVAWSLWLAHKLKIKISEKSLRQIIGQKKGGSISILLSLFILLPMASATTRDWTYGKMKFLEREDIFESEYWLLAYEIYIHNLLPALKIKIPGRDPFFMTMKKLGISFFNPKL